METNNIMLDLETMSLDSNAAIISIGAARFDLNAKVIRSSFYQPVFLESNRAYGRVTDEVTFRWWQTQSEVARKVLTDERRVDLEEALRLFGVWAGEQPVVWGNGAGFDNVILANAYKAVGRLIPWEFYNNRCYRTVAALQPEIKRPFNCEAHNALADAETQVQHMFLLFP